MGTPISTVRTTDGDLVDGRHCFACRDDDFRERGAVEFHQIKLIAAVTAQLLKNL